MTSPRHRRYRLVKVWDMSISAYLPTRKEREALGEWVDSRRQGMHTYGRRQGMHTYRVERHWWGTKIFTYAHRKGQHYLDESTGEVATNPPVRLWLRWVKP